MIVTNCVTLISVLFNPINGCSSETAEISPDITVDLQSSSEHVISKLVKTREIQHMCQEDWENAKSLAFLFAQVDGINKPSNLRHEKVVDDVTNLLLCNMLVIPLSTEPSN